MFWIRVPCMVQVSIIISYGNAVYTSSVCTAHVDSHVFTCSLCIKPPVYLVLLSVGLTTSNADIVNLVTAFTIMAMIMTGVVIDYKSKNNATPSPLQ